MEQAVEAYKNTIKFQIIGEQGAQNLDKVEEATYRMDNLIVTKDMEQNGKTPKEIRLATGWEKGVDNLWRYEILDGTVSPINLNPTVKSPLFEEKVTEVSLKEIYNNSELYKAYPQIGNTKVYVYETDVPLYDENKMFALEGNIYINKKTYDVRENKLYYGESEGNPLQHEIQHNIQFIEGFAVGSSREQNKQRIYEAIENFRKTYDRAEPRPNQEGGYNEYIFRILQEKLPKELVDSLLEGDNTFLERIAGVMSQTAYEGFAGEVEARNVEKRLFMSPQERLEQTLKDTQDIPYEDQFVLQFDTKVQASSDLVNQLKKTGLADNVYELTNQEIEDKLVELGVDTNVAKQVDSFVNVYRGIKGDFKSDFKGTQYFAVNKRYAGVFGNNIEEFKLKSSEVLDLDEWNKKLELENEFLGQGFLTIHSDNIDNPEEWSNSLYEKLMFREDLSEEALISIIKEFESAVKNAKIIKGEDVGNNGQIVYAVKDKTLIEPINKQIQFQKSGITPITNGFIYKNDVYLNKETATDNTKVHEFNHLYNKWLKQNRPEVYKKGLDLVKVELEKTAKVSFSKQSIDNENKDFIQDFSTATVKGKEYQFLKAGNVFYVEVDGVGEVAKATLNKDGYLDNIRVDENYRRKGIGSSLYDYIENISGNTLKPSPIKISKEAQSLWEKRERKSEIQDIIDFVTTNQSNLKGERLFEEILTELVGRKGAQILESKSSLGKLLEEIWNEIKSLLGLSQYSTEQVKNMTLQEYSDAVAVDLIRGEKLKQNKGFNEAVEQVAKNANEYKTSKGIKGVASQPLYEIDASMSQEIAKQYEEASVTSNSQAVKDAYEALEKETIEQYDFILSKGLKVEKYEGVGEPYKNSKEMLSDIRDNNTLRFLPNEGAFGQESGSTENRIGLQPSGRVLDNGYEMTLSEVFRVVHDYFGHGILGNQFGAIGEENATLQHLDLYSAKALPAVVFQTRGQNSWVNYSGANTEAKKLQKQAKEENNAEKLAESEKMFKFAEPKDNIFPPIYNFKRYETVRRIQEQRENEKQEQYIDPRTRDANINLSTELSSNVEKSRSTRGVSRRGVQGTRSIQQFELEVIAEYELDQAIDKGIKKAFPTFKGVQKILEVTDGKAFRELMIESLNDNPFKSSVTLHTAEEYSKMRMFITEDGSTGITLTKEGFLGGAWSNPNANRPSNLSQLLVLGIKEGALIAEAFDTVLPDMYADYGLKAVSRTPFDEAQRPLVENGALEDWDYKKYKRFNQGRPDVVFFIYDGGSRDTIEDRLGQFDRYQEYQKEQTVELPYEDSYRYMQISAINKANYNNKDGVETVTEVYNNLKENMGRTTLEDVLKAEKEMGTEKTIEYLKKCR